MSEVEEKKEVREDTPPIIEPIDFEGPLATTASDVALEIPISPEKPVPVVPVQQDSTEPISSASVSSKEDDAQSSSDSEIQTQAFDTSSVDSRPTSLPFQDLDSESSGSAPTTQYIQTSLITNPKNVEIAVTGMQLSKSAINKHIRYDIKGSYDGSPFETSRRYKDFNALRQIFVVHWPGCFIPTIPPKKKLGNKEAWFVEQRREFLDTFLKQIIGIDILFESDEFQLFLRGPPDFQKAVGSFKKVKGFQAISQTYNSVFSHYQEYVLTDAVISSIGTSRNFFGDVHNHLKVFKQSIKEARVLYDSFQASIGALNATFTFCEDQILSSYSDEGYLPVFQDGFSLDSNANPFRVLYLWLKIEKLDILAMIECFNKVDELESQLRKTESKLTADSKSLVKLQIGKKSMSSIFSTKSVPKQIEALEKQLENHQSEITALKRLIHNIQVRLWDYEIPRFKQVKAKRYEEGMTKYASSALPEFKSLLATFSEIKTRVN